ncbi:MULTISPECIES: RrF2 family transcriptional regulator [Bombella]|uniref:Rrf2 family transcriptional regulator n=1 Tax=Bombella pollinis TaxID=2967337 RepID=A0ABT3WIR8_9PROT|nr:MULTISPECIES: Rrf2 family transcriptional regulator [Bombella]MCT6855767.1 Rrf2 family transcriptional regulator [Bombella apis]MCX5619010.1 Rrf2 family transcriptional regulator [Bombella pollinis]MUG05374.1 Rrf2 family transcriptional regulator [Bombella sp. ESL0378]MUG89467.1 Rrf2 family transcriptional regulator [Bombella sp. ESL0385]
MYLKTDRILTALSIMLDVAFYAGRSGVASGADIAQRSGLLRRGIEPVLQALSRAGLLDSIRGPKGGYRLGRSPRVVNLHEIASAVGAYDSSCFPVEQDNPLRTLVMKPLWEELNDGIKGKLGNITLADLLQQAERLGLERPRQIPISFTI